ncbi:hypothetical protein G6F24_009413 [Rhizopus arrhizus]|nr:hypothetical protein G6F24_009413 [Rhizopus arrhizus]
MQIRTCHRARSSPACRPRTNARCSTVSARSSSRSRSTRSQSGIRILRQKIGDKGKQDPHRAPHVEPGRRACYAVHQQVPGGVEAPALHRPQLDVGLGRLELCLGAAKEHRLPTSRSNIPNSALELRQLLADRRRGITPVEGIHELDKLVVDRLPSGRFIPLCDALGAMAADTFATAVVHP